MTLPAAAATSWSTEQKRAQLAELKEKLATLHSRSVVSSSMETGEQWAWPSGAQTTYLVQLKLFMHLSSYGVLTEKPTWAARFEWIVIHAAGLPVDDAIATSSIYTPKRKREEPLGELKCMLYVTGKHRRDSLLHVMNNDRFLKKMEVSTCNCAHENTPSNSPVKTLIAERALGTKCRPIPGGEPVRLCRSDIN
jgi:hypothetical protein